MDANTILKQYLVPRTNTNEISDRFIDVKEVIRKKSPKAAKLLPAFVFRLIERIIHQDEINRMVYTYREDFGLSFVNKCLDDLGVRLQVEGLENIQADTRYLIASNHPLGGLDGLSLISAISDVRKDIVFPVNDILLNVPQLQPLFIPVNKHGSNAENRNVFNAAFESDYMILYFPAGLVSRKHKGIIRDPEWKKTFITKAVSYQRDVLPVFINGKNSNFFYSFANWRVRLGIKMNIEMALLPDELYSSKQRDIHIRIGKPLSYSTFTKDKRPIEWAALMREHVYRLAEGHDDFDGLKNM